VDANVSDLDDTMSLPARDLYFDRVKCSNVNDRAILKVAAD
jgi:hypothetical protein